MNSAERADELLTNIQTRLPELEALLEQIGSDHEYEDPVYRFYYHSRKVYAVQDLTKLIVEVLRSIAPKGTKFCQTFEELYQAGASGKEFELGYNRHWTAHTRVFIEAFFHAKFFLEMAVKYGKELKTSPREWMPSGWAALLCLYGLR